jgi:hypothetical protein
MLPFGFVLEQCFRQEEVTADMLLSGTEDFPSIVWKPQGGKQQYTRKNPADRKGRQQALSKLKLSSCNWQLHT